MSRNVLYLVFLVVGFALGAASDLALRWDSGLENPKPEETATTNIPRPVTSRTQRKDGSHDERFGRAKAVIGDLRNGGYILFLRHTSREKLAEPYSQAAFDNTSMTEPPIDVGTFRKAICLDEQGLAEARMLGQALSRLKIPIGDVLVSPTCRAKETAHHVFPDKEFQVEPALVPHYMQGTSDYRAGIRERLKRILSTTPDARTNTLLSSHGNVLEHIGIGQPTDFKMGSVIVFKPKADALPEPIMTVQLSDWVELLPKRRLGDHRNH